MARADHATSIRRPCWRALPDPVIVIDEGNFILWVNNAGEQFLDASAATLRGCALADLLPADSPLFNLIEAVRRTDSSIAEYGVPIETPRLGAHVMTIQVAAARRAAGPARGDAARALDRP